MLNVEYHIALRTKDELEQETLKCWYKTVREAAPSGVIATTQTTDQNGNPASVSLLHRSIKGEHTYLIPLTRDLTDKEADRIVAAFCKASDVDFEIETSSTKMLVSQGEGIVLDQNHYLELCMGIAKRKHEDWVRERLDAGWRYGSEFDTDEKTHPLLVAWDRLPDRYRVPDMDTPQKVVDSLDGAGYAVIAKDDLSRISALIRALT
jgi:hypothetical protein